MSIGDNVRAMRRSKKYRVELRYFNKNGKKGKRSRTEERSVSMVDLASELGVAYSTIARLEANKIRPGIDLVLAIARYFGCTPNDILKGEY